MYSRKKTKVKLTKQKDKVAKAKEDLDKILKKVGYTGKLKESVNEIPNYKQETGRFKSSDQVCSHGPKRPDKEYTGDEIMGIATTHKSNLIPIRKDNRKAAIDAAGMRR